jgi:hypothetical protein
VDAVLTASGGEELRQEADREIDMASLYIGKFRYKVSPQNAKKPETRNIAAVSGFRF